jgi:hypothetical protein
MLPTVANRKRFLPVSGTYEDGTAWHWGPAPKPLTGRERRPAMPEDAVFVGRPSPLGNPYRLDHRTGEVFDAESNRVGFGRVDALRLFRVWLHERLVADDPAVWRALRSIGPATLIVCSCAPKPCHADVIRSAWVWAQNEGLL